MPILNILSLSLLLIGGSSASCPLQYYPIVSSENGLQVTCIRIVDELMNFRDHLQNCAQDGTELAQPTLVVQENLLTLMDSYGK